MYRLVLFPGILFLLMILSLRADVKLSALFSNARFCSVLPRFRSSGQRNPVKMLPFISAEFPAGQ